MVRIGSRNNVALTLTGPKSILPQSLTLDADLNITWFELLRNELGLEITPESGVFICTSRYSRLSTSPNDQRSWRAELHEKVGEYVNKFERKRESYTARLALVNPNNGISFSDGGHISYSPSNRSYQRSQGAAGSKRGNISSRSVPLATSQNPSFVIPLQRIVPDSSQPSTSASIGTGRLINDSPRASQNGRKRLLNGHRNQDPSMWANGQPQNMGASSKRSKNQSRVPTNSVETEENSVPQIIGVRSCVKVEPTNDLAQYWDESEAEERDSNNVNTNGSNGAENEDLLSDSGHGGDGDLSLDSAVTTEETESCRNRIQADDIKSLVKRRFSRFSNAYLLRVRNEMEKLQGNNLWDRNVSRSPLACYFLQEILDD